MARETTGDSSATATLRYATKISSILRTYPLFLMQTYLTNVWGVSITHAAYIVMLRGGIGKALPIFSPPFGTFNEYWLTLASNTANFMGIALCSISTPIVLASSTGRCNYPQKECIGHTHKVVLYIGMALLAIGEAGDLIGEQLFPSQSRDNYQPRDQRRRRLIVKALVVVIAMAVSIALYTLVPYKQVWTVIFAVPAAVSAVIITFVIIPNPAHLERTEEVITPVNSVRKVVLARFLNSPTDQPYLPQDDPRLKQRKYVSEAQKKEAKVFIHIAPLYVFVIICGMVSSVGDTYFLEQADQMNRKIGTLNVPLPFLLVIIECLRMSLNKLAKFLLNDEKKPVMAPYKGILLGMTSSALCCIAAALVERRRLKVVRDHGLLESPYDPIPMHVYWLLFQILLLAGLDSFLDKSVKAHIKKHAPLPRVDFYCYLTKLALGLGSKFNMLLIFSLRGMGFDWFQHTLNMSRLDKYYWSLAFLSTAALIAFPFCISHIIDVPT